MERISLLGVGIGHVIYPVQKFFLLLGYILLCTGIPTGLQAQLVTTVAGTVETPGDDDGHAINDALFSNPHGIASDKFGRIYVADRWNHKIRVLDTRTDSVYTLAGTGTIGTDDGPGHLARFYSPWGLTCDSLGTVYVADTKNQLIRKIDTLGNVTTYAGSGTFGVMDGPSASARFADPTGITIAVDGTIFLCDHVAHTIRKITPAGVVTTIAGAAFLEGDTDGTGSQARFNRPYGIELNAAGDILIADEWNHKIRKVSPNGFTTTIAGSGLLGSDDGPASTARFNYPWDVVEDKDGAIYVMDGYNHIIRRIHNGSVVTWVGTSGETGGQDGYGINASFSGATAICYHPRTDYLYIGDAFNDLVRRVEKSSGVNVSSSTHLNGDTACLGETATFVAAPDFYQSYDFQIGGVSVQNSSSTIFELLLSTVGEVELTVEAAHIDGYTVVSSPFILEVVQPPTSDFSYTIQSESGNGYEVAFQSLGSGGLAWRWNFGDTLSGPANTSTLENPTHLYQSEGAYDVSLVTIGQGGCTDSLHRERFVAFLSLDSSPLVIQPEDSLCAGELITFTANTSIYSSYLFYVNEQLVQSGTSLSYSHLFDQQGPQSVYVVGIEANGDSTYANSIDFYVAAYPVSDFSVTVEEQNEQGFTVSFDYIGSGALSWLWNFGDSTSGPDNQSFAQNPTHIYTEAGSYDVQLISIGEGGCADSLLKADAVALLELHSLPEELAADDTLCVGSSTKFVALPDIFDSYTFSINGEVLQNSPSNEFDYVFEFVRTDEIQVTGLQSNGKSANSILLPIHVVAYPQAEIAYEILGQIDQGFEVEFEYTGTGANNFLWDFGDPQSGPDNVSTLSQPIHLYQEEGLYDVQLIATGAGGCKDTILKQDFVILLDVLASTIERNDTVCVGHACTFSANTDIFEAYVFSVNGMQVQASASSEYSTIFNSSGQYSISIAGRLADGQIVQSSDFVFEVTDVPSIDFVMTDQTLDRNGLTVQFQTSTANALTYNWTFGDSSSLENTSTEQNPAHTYAQFGAYDVSLTIGTGGQCRDSLSKLQFVIFEDKPANLFVPTAFTPNGDGVNDVLFLRGQNISEMTFTIFNEWGEVIFQSQAPDHGWDGSYQGSAVAPDTYIYVGRVTLANGEVEVIKGQTTVIR
ncbi:MAG: PKD domain-containing protein [Bacteroidota bacterium]